MMSPAQIQLVVLVLVTGLIDDEQLQPVKLADVD